MMESEMPHCLMPEVVIQRATAAFGVLGMT